MIVILAAIRQDIKCNGDKCEVNQVFTITFRADQFSFMSWLTTSSPLLLAGQLKSRLFCRSRFMKLRRQDWRELPRKLSNFQTLHDVDRRARSRKYRLSLLAASLI